MISENENYVQKTFGNYIIRRIHKEDLSFEDMICIKENENNFEHEKLNENDIETKINFKEKIEITSLILNYSELILDFEDFYDEDCQLSLLIWAYKCSKNINLVENSILYRKNLEILLYNILNIFEIFPIKPNDLISLNFIEKLNKIKYIVKNFNIDLYSKIKNLLNYWKNLINIYNSNYNLKVSNINLLNKKREREDEEKDEDSTLISSETYISRNSDLNNSRIKKNVSWKEEIFLIDYCEFDPNKSPIEDYNKNE